jgi:hypothetical protein
VSQYLKIGLLMFATIISTNKPSFQPHLQHHAYLETKYTHWIVSNVRRLASVNRRCHLNSYTSEYKSSQIISVRLLQEKMKHAISKIEFADFGVNELCRGCRPCTGWR